MLQKLQLILIVLCCVVSTFIAQEKGDNISSEKPWAIGLTVRSATIPFAVEGSKAVASVVPMLFFQGNYFYMRGIEGGIKFYKTENWDLTVFGRLHFFDFPKEYQNQIQGDNVDWGLRYNYALTNWSFADLELASDWDGNFSSNVHLGYRKETDRFRFDSYFELKWKSKKYNSHFFGLDSLDVNSGFDFSVGLITDYHVTSNFYLFATAQLTLLGKNTRNVSFVNSDIMGEAYLGFGFSNDRTKPRKKKLENKPYIRIAQGFATPSDLSNILKLKSKPDSNGNKMTSIYYGHPLTDRLLGIPLHIYLAAGAVYHWPSAVQKDALEVDLEIKLFYVIKWPVRWRLGAGEGFSYVNEVPYVERNELENKGYVPSKLMNHLDFSIDFNVGDIFGDEVLKRAWLGYGIHHRSSIFETAQQFGRISGGSNFNAFYIQWDL
ncbi:MAG: MipA/OmpV family protein [Chlorobi bacterium]|nr:MipA/OmpV family protein [Chlorobiota bacterium]